MRATSGFAMELRTEIPFAECITRITKALQHEGFGILTEIDVQSTLKEKLGLETKPYQILGACNPPFAHQALEIEPLIGVLLPCNVVVIEEGAGRRVAAMDPGFMSQVIDHPEIGPVAQELRERIARALRSLEA